MLVCRATRLLKCNVQMILGCVNGRESWPRKTIAVFSSVLVKLHSYSGGQILRKLIHLNVSRIGWNEKCSVNCFLCVCVIKISIMATNWAKFSEQKTPFCFLSPFPWKYGVLRRPLSKCLLDLSKSSALPISNQKLLAGPPGKNTESSWKRERNNSRTMMIKVVSTSFWRVDFLQTHFHRHIDLGNVGLKTYSFLAAGFLWGFNMWMCKWLSFPNLFGLLKWTIFKY